VIWFLVGTMNTALGVERVLDKIVATLARHKKMCIAICFSGVAKLARSIGRMS
jgi:hypothetical protein